MNKNSRKRQNNKLNPKLHKRKRQVIYCSHQIQNKQLLNKINKQNCCLIINKKKQSNNNKINKKKIEKCHNPHRNHNLYSIHLQNRYNLG